LLTTAAEAKITAFICLIKLPADFMQHFYMADLLVRLRSWIATPIVTVFTVH